MLRNIALILEITEKKSDTRPCFSLFREIIK